MQAFTQKYFLSSFQPNYGYESKCRGCREEATDTSVLFCLLFRFLCYFFNFLRGSVFRSLESGEAAGRKRDLPTDLLAQCRLA